VTVFAGACGGLVSFPSAGYAYGADFDLDGGADALICVVLRLAGYILRPLATLMFRYSARRLSMRLRLPDQIHAQRYFEITRFFTL
jgi:hypothetical protein